MSVVTVARLEHALVFVAWIIETFGEEYMPIFERLEKELAQARSEEQTLSRVKRVLAEQRAAT